MFPRLRSVIRGLLGRRRFEDGMAEELRIHVDQCAEDLVRSGVPRDEARRRARAEFGGVERVKEECREARWLHVADGLRRDATYAARLMRRSPGFTATALAVLALCLGANLTVFAVVDAVLLRPLPFPAAGRLMTVFNTYPKAGVPNDGCSLTNYYERRGRITAFSSISAYREMTATVGDTGAPERAAVTRVSPEFFATLGMPLAMGRAFTDAETVPGADRVAIVTDTFWREHLSGDPHVLGRTIRVNGGPVTVVGVLPAAFRFLSSDALLYFPLASTPEERSPQERHSGNSKMVARLAPGVSVAEAQAQIDAHNAAVEVDDPMAKPMAEAGFRSIVAPLQADHVAAVRPVLILVEAGALFLLLIGVVNLANLLLVRASARAGERAVRQAIGASRRDIAAGILVEATLLTLTGGAFALLVGAAGIHLLMAIGVDQLPLGARIALDPRLAFMALAASAALGVAIGAPIAWFSLRDRPASPLQFDARTTTAGRAAQRLRHGFVVAQVALAFVLLAGANVLDLSVRRAMSVTPGFRPAGVVAGRLLVSGSDFPTRADLLTFVDRLDRELGRTPGVQAAGITTNVPLSGVSNKSAVTVKGYVPAPGESLQAHYSYSVDGDFFGAIGATLLDGRVLTAEDSQRDTRVCVVDEDFARHYWPGRSAIGQRVFSGGKAGPDAEAFTIVGVVSPMKQAALTDVAAQGAAFFPFAYRMDGDFYVVVRTSLSSDAIAGTVRRVVRGLAPELPVSDLVSMDARVADSLVARRSPALLASVFAAIALLLTAVGTYGVVSFAVAERRREIGVRVALGARPAQVRRQFAAVAARLVATGTALGLAGFWLASRGIQHALFQVSALNLWTIAVTAAIVGAVSAAACVLPSHRAAHISPMEAMARR